MVVRFSTQTSPTLLFPPPHSEKLINSMTVVTLQKKKKEEEEEEKKKKKKEEEEEEEEKEEEEEQQQQQKKKKKKKKKRRRRRRRTRTTRTTTTTTRSSLKTTFVYSLFFQKAIFCLFGLTFLLKPVAIDKRKPEILFNFNCLSFAGTREELLLIICMRVIHQGAACDTFLWQSFS